MDTNIFEGSTVLITGASSGIGEAFVMSFSEALAAEYGGRGTRVLALCPGNAATNFMSTANAHTAGMSFAAPVEVAGSGLQAFAEGKIYHVPGLADYLTSLLPRILSRARVLKIVERMFNKRVTPWPT